LLFTSKFGLQRVELNIMKDYGNLNFVEVINGTRL
jgi:hypothetical protein